MWYLLWFVGILLMCSLSTLALVWLESPSTIKR
ncbi:cytochrome bd-II oxidase subunit CbdX [Salmonella enterica subsp. enterica serovar Typhimurium]|nr:cytochrome bd-II oxidase subunit CbdX [Salmonella enterica subsp. enterica serovar Typhimurium]EHG1893225.1 cytochrome bd-II oxidase subunit CbdX [Salmonella enterica subsp. enterica serovar Typhimurium]EIZ4718566.1 cytochrome bd-II oxidase subunit CbdX [Salmonella enterica subsp. enterica serovar Typhimurium]